jgi:FlgD Ig-like domain
LSAIAEMSGADADGPAADRLARGVFALLVLACFAAFIVTQRLKHTPTAVQQFRLTPRFSPTPSGHIKEERISFKLARADEVTVVILNTSGDEVATLARDRAVPRYKPYKLRWNGMTRGGGPAPAGEYRVRVTLRKQHRTVLGPRSFTLVRK